MTQLYRMAVSCCLLLSLLPSPAKRDPGSLSLCLSHIYISEFLKIISFWQHWVFVESHGPSLAVASGLLPVVALLLWSTGSGRQQLQLAGPRGLSGCGAWASLLQPVESSGTRD